MKIVLINYYLRINDYPTKYSLAVLRLAEYLNSLGYEVDILPLSLKDVKVDEVVRNDLALKYDIVGISNYVWSEKITIELARVIREIDANIDVIIGGPAVNYIDLNDYEDEFFILGEGEEALANTVEYIVNGKVDDNFFDNNLNVFNKSNPDAVVVESDIKYINPLFTRFWDIDRDFLYYETSRGCCYKCGYCGFRNREKVVDFDLDFIKEEIIKIGELGFKNVFVVDANFGGSLERAKEILWYFLRFAPMAQLIIYLRPEFIDDEMIEIMSNVNLKEVRIGIQTVNDSVPSWVRANSMRHIIEQLPKLSLNNINWKAELIIGLPGDNFKGLEKSIGFVVDVLKPTEFCCYPLTLIKGTPMYDLVDNFDNDLWVKIDENSSVLEASTYTHEELLKMQEYAMQRMNSYLGNSKKLDNNVKKRNLKNNIYKDIT